jgi:hypothetical protein
MEVSPMKRVAIFFLIISPLLILAPFIRAKKPPKEGITNYAGQYFKDPSSPGYASYDQKMSVYVARRIKAQYNVDLDYTLYSAFDLLEIEALLKCKKSGEPVDSLLEPFQK